MLLMLRLWGCLCIKCINLKSLLHLLHENLLILLWRFLCWTVLFLLLKILSYTSHVHSPVLFYCNNYTKVSAMYGKLAPWRPIHSVHCSINPPPPITNTASSFLPGLGISALPPLNLQAVQTSPPFLGNSSLYIAFSCLPIKIQFFSEPP